MIIIPFMPEWPPKKRCENCRFWTPHWLITLFGLKGKMGQCEVLEDRTWKSFSCIRWSEMPKDDWRTDAASHRTSEEK